MFKIVRLTALLTIVGFLAISPIGSYATEIVKYVGNPIIVYLNPHVTRSITFPYYFSKIITGIDTSKLSVEKSNKTLFLKPLGKHVQGDFYVTETNGTIIHLLLKTTKKKDYEGIRIVLPTETARKTAEKYRTETAAGFLKRIIRGNLSNVDVEKAKGNVNITISKSLVIQIVKVYEDPIYKAYYGYVYNNTNRTVRIPVEDIYYKGLIGISPEKLYLGPHSKTNIYFVTYK